MYETRFALPFTFRIGCAQSIEHIALKKRPPAPNKKMLARSSLFVKGKILAQTIDTWEIRVIPRQNQRKGRVPNLRHPMLRFFADTGGFSGMIGITFGKMIWIRTDYSDIVR